MRKMKTILLATVAVMGLTMCTQNKQTAAVEEPVDSCAVMPEFPGGTDSLVAYLASGIQYPQKAMEVGMEGRVLVKFVVEKDGSVNDVEVAEPFDSLLDTEAVRVVSTLPAFTPGTNEAGEAQRVKFVVPIVFLMPDMDEKVDEKPEFPGGMDGLLKFMNDNLKYPAECEAEGIEGRVLIRMTVDEKGSIADPILLKSANPLLDAEAMRVVKLMPKWKPAINEGKPVAVKYVVPITFRLK